MNDWQGRSYDRPDSAAQTLLRHAQAKAEGEAPADAGAPSATSDNPWIDDPQRDELSDTSPTREMSSMSESAGEILPSAAHLMVQAKSAPRPLATEGWRLGVRRWSLGLIKPAASKHEMRRLADARDAGLQLTRPMKVVVAHPKGGVGKTPLVVMLAAALGMYRGGAVAAWDAHESQGTLGLRTEAGRFATTTSDLLAVLDQFEGDKGRRGELGAFLRHQQSGSFDVLASAETSEQLTSLDTDSFTRIQKVLERYYQVIVVDTGNSMLSPAWTAAMQSADLLVMPMRWSRDHVASAGVMIDRLHAIGRGDLIPRAVTVVSHAAGEYVDQASAPKWREWFRDSTGALLEIPFDPHVAAGEALRYDRLAPLTQRALLALAAEVSRHLSVIDSSSISLPTLPEGHQS